MKRNFLILASFFFSVIASAQHAFEPQTYFGVKFGGNISGVLFNPVIDQKINTGLTGGVVFKDISQKSLGVQIELNFKQSGWNENLDSTNSYNRILEFIELPFMTHINLGNRNTRFVINLGPYISYLFSEKEKINLLEESVERDYYRRRINNAGYGLSLGIGVSQHTSYGLFQLEIRANTSLTDLFKRTTDLSVSSSKNINAELSLSYMLDYKTLYKRPGKPWL